MKINKELKLQIEGVISEFNIMNSFEKYFWILFKPRLTYVIIYFSIIYLFPNIKVHVTGF